MTTDDSEPTLEMSFQTAATEGTEPMFASMTTLTTTTWGRRAGVALLAAVSLLGIACDAAGAIRPGQPAAASGPAVATSDTRASATVVLVVDNARAARERHDERAYIRFTQQLSRLVGAATLRDAHAAYRTAAADIAAAIDRHDARSEARFRTELAAMCKADSVISAIEPCP